ncbi:MAG: beta-class carbonic anhydrase [Motilibacteraceae bacterium]
MGAEQPGDPFADVLAANSDYVEHFALGGLTGKAGRGLAVLTCMDSRIEPLSMLGLHPGDAKILRNAGARVTDDVLRTLVVAAHLLEVDRVLVVAHTHCRMSSDPGAIPTAIAERSGIDVRSLDLATVADMRGTLADDVQRIRSWPYLPAGLPVAGAVYDVDTGKLEIVEPAVTGGAASVSRPDPA